MAVERAPRSLSQLPHALGPSALLDRSALDRLDGRRPVVFLDYDGTLTPIVDHPDRADLAETTRQAVAHLAAVMPVAVVSGRDRVDVAARVGLDRLVYAGSHGFDIAGPGWSYEHPGGPVARAALAAAADDLDRAVGAITGVVVERKAFAVAVHFRRAAAPAVAVIDRAVDQAIERHPGLRRTTGKMVFELRPDIDWDKGRALRFLLRQLGRAWPLGPDLDDPDLDDPDIVAVYVGDDDTDEDALAVVAPDGLGVIVGGDDRPTWAHLRLADPGEVAEFLTRLTSLQPGL